MSSTLKKPIIIGSPQNGIARSSVLGLAEIRGLDITKKPGVCFPNKSLSKETATTITGSIQGITAEGLNPGIDDIWTYSSDRKVFKRTAQDTWAAITGHTDEAILGIQYYKGYVGIVYDQTIDWYDVSDDSADTSWGNDITSGGVIKPTSIGSDDSFYLGSGNVLDKIYENGGQNFDPATGSTFTISKAVITLPEDERIQDILNITNYLCLVTANKIYLWNYYDSNITRVLYVNKPIGQVIVYNNALYINAGYDGEWFYSTGAYVEPLVNIPETLTNAAGKTLVIGKPCIKNELIYFGVGAASGETFNGQGVYSLNPRNGAMAMEFTISSGGDGNSHNIVFGPLMALNTVDFLLVPWSENSVYGIDRRGSTRNTGDTAFFVTQIMSLGGKTSKVTLGKIEIQLSKAIISGDSLKIYTRTGINGTWTQHGSTWSTIGDQSNRFPSIVGIESIQFKIVLNNEAEFLKLTLG